MTFSSPPGEGLGAVKSTAWKDILKTRCWSTNVTDGKPLVTVPLTRALRELLRKAVTSQRAKQSHERPEGLTLRTVHCLSLSGIWDSNLKSTQCYPMSSLSGSISNCLFTSGKQNYNSHISKFISAHSQTVQGWSWSSMEMKYGIVYISYYHVDQPTKSLAHSQCSKHSQFWGIKIFSR